MLSDLISANTYTGSGGKVPRIPELRARWKWLISFTLRRFKLGEKVSGISYENGCVSKPSLNARTPVLQPIALHVIY
jgi:hypothetical protein